jgi:hypothetical protein
MPLTDTWLRRGSAAAHIRVSSNKRTSDSGGIDLYWSPAGAGRRRSRNAS